MCRPQRRHTELLEPCVLCQNRDAVLGRVCDPCSQGLLSVLSDVERDIRDLIGVGDLLGAVKATGDPFSYRGSGGFGSSKPAGERCSLEVRQVNDAA